MVFVWLYPTHTIARSAPSIYKFYKNKEKKMIKNFGFFLAEKLGAGKIISGGSSSIIINHQCTRYIQNVIPEQPTPSVSNEIHKMDYALSMAGRHIADHQISKKQTATAKPYQNGIHFE